MNRKFTQVLLSISLASFISCAPSVQSALERNKRSFYHPNPAHRLLSHLWVPGRHKNDQHGAIKRSGLSLDFIDSLLNEFAEEPEEEPLPSNSLLHESSLHGESLTQEPMFNEAHNQESMLANLLAPEKDPMSNVIPGNDTSSTSSTKGAEGPFHIENKLSPPTEHQQKIADHLMDDFLLFLSLKDLGMLDQCLGFKRR